VIGCGETVREVTAKSRKGKTRREAQRGGFFLAQLCAETLRFFYAVVGVFTNNEK